MNKPNLVKTEEAWIRFAEAIRNEAVATDMSSKWKQMSKTSTLGRRHSKVLDTRKVSK